MVENKRITTLAGFLNEPPNSRMMYIQLYLNKIKRQTFLAGLSLAGLTCSGARPPRISLPLNPATKSATRCLG